MHIIIAINIILTLCERLRPLGALTIHLCTDTPTVDTSGGSVLFGSRRTESKVVLPRPYECVCTDY